MLKEYFVGKQTWERQFFCDNWSHQKYQVVYLPISNNDKTGACYLDHNSQPPPAPTPGPPPAPTPGPGPAPVGGVIRYVADKNKCLDIPGGSLKNGNKLQIWDCNNVAANQNWIYKDNSLRVGANTNKCIDFGARKHGTPLQIWDCNNQDQQKVTWDHKTQTYKMKKAYNTDHCIDLKDGSTASGNTVQVWYCTNGPPASQQWTGPPTALQGKKTQTEDTWTLHI